MNKETEKKLAASLTSETTELLPFIPYILQDFWELGSSPQDIVHLIKKHMALSDDSKFLDLACGKGAVSIEIAEKLNKAVMGVDLITEFIEEANAKTKELQVDSLCKFVVGDVNEFIHSESDYDAVIFGAAADILGSPEETLKKLQRTVKEDGYVIIDEAYVSNVELNNQVNYHNYDYLTRLEWLDLFEKNNLELIEELEGSDDVDYEQEKQYLIDRSNELIQKYPEKKKLFDGYLRSQLAEYDDLDQHIIAVTWILQRK
ncbi:class I SAM-dependent methyltransferase [Enterococcus termitis]|uniref:SAM-dependent methyltransferase n=1 Tax=Enterococcus termitis TaxID=332950 RepID=A0A1E5GKD7_9ENTE|nr:class I SAM-dependent methyltransferase [Enterococcus termitis]OEG13152.1 SAM-dependent methyltransferase [Enterococcus termitis]OJG98981.1 methyltransferase [Enterococcus termitis]